MAPRLLIRVLCWLCLYSVHGQVAPWRQDMKEPGVFVTDGTRNLSLICLAPNASEENRYEWFTPGNTTNDINRCETTQEDTVCTFQPRLEDDKQNVRCRAFDKDQELYVAVYQLNLQYPPEFSPSITTGSTQTYTVKQGDVITCTVTGGKPRVTNVTFHCQHPDQADREDDVSDDGTTVSSSITVNTSQASNQSMSCNCSAYWDPEPGLYNETVYKEFILGPPGDSEALSLGAIVGIATGAVIVIAVVVATVVICTIKKRKNKKRKPTRNKSRDYYENPELIMEDMQSRQVATAGQPQAHGSQSPYAVSTVHQNKAFQINDDGGEYDVLGKPKPKPAPGPVPIYSHLS